MKKIIVISALFIMLTNTSFAFYGSGMNTNFFYNSLEPYGEWIEIDYDVIAWRPYDARYSWRPYSDGRWEWTSNGWYWVSYEPFGWATYHYGRWFYDDYFGWMWIPDNEWGPAWVEWRYNDDYLGWAPLPPYAAFHVDRGIHFSVSWRSKYHHWNFINYHNFCSRQVNVFIVDNYNSYKIFNKTKYRTNYYSSNGRIVNGGVDRRVVEKRSGVKIAERTISTTSRMSEYSDGRKNVHDRVIAYRPTEREIEKTRKVDRSRIVKSRGETSLNTEKIAVRKNVVGKELERNVERTVVRNTNDIKRTERIYKRDDNKSIKVKSATKSFESKKNKRELIKVKHEPNEISKAKDKENKTYKRKSKTLRNESAKTKTKQTVSKRNVSSNSNDVKRKSSTVKSTVKKTKPSNADYKKKTSVKREEKKTSTKSRREIKKPGVRK